jgi:hypothetical protein
VIIFTIGRRKVIDGSTIGRRKVIDGRELNPHFYPKKAIDITYTLYFKGYQHKPMHIVT